MTNSRTLGIVFAPDLLGEERKGVLGYATANASILKAIGRSDAFEKFFCRAPAVHWVKKLASALGDPKTPVEFDDSVRRGEPTPFDALLHLGGGLSELSWPRWNGGGNSSYSICSLLHTTYGPALGRIRGILTSPTQPWDALLCSSLAVKRVVQSVLEAESSFLEQRLGGKAPLLPQLPVIPLGVSIEEFGKSPSRVAAGKTLRWSLEIPDEAVVILFLGRLSWVDKSNPIPLFLALKELSARSSIETHLVVAGWAHREQDFEEIARAGRYWCPSVPIHWLDGKQHLVRENVWHAADVFVSLADSTQETFGLTVLEAMAAGLPVVVSDWNGYRETVRHGEDGFRVPTTLPESVPLNFGLYPPGPRSGSPQGFLRRISQLTAVDVDATVEALQSLVESPELRARMGTAAALRARCTFGWATFVDRLVDLLDELRQIRKASSTQNLDVHRDSGRSPIEVFGNSASRLLGPKHEIQLAQVRSGEARSLIAESILTHGMTNQQQVGLERLVEAAGCRSSWIVSELCEEAGLLEDDLYLVVWLLKAGLIRICEGS